MHDTPERREADDRAPDDTVPSAAARSDALDVLIAQQQALFQLYESRRSNAETAAEAVITTSAGMLTLTLTVFQSHVKTATWIPIGVVAASIAAIVIALWARIGPAGLTKKRSREAVNNVRTESRLPELRTRLNLPAVPSETSAQREAEKDLDKAGAKEVLDGVELRGLAYLVWRERTVRATLRRGRKRYTVRVAAAVMCIPLPYLLYALIHIAAHP